MAECSIEGLDVQLKGKEEDSLKQRQPKTTYSIANIIAAHIFDRLKKLLAIESPSIVCSNAIKGFGFSEEIPIYEEPSKEEQINNLMLVLLGKMTTLRPEQRSAKSRDMAISITQLQLAQSNWQVNVLPD